MPNILKGFLRPKVEDYAFPDSDQLPVEPDPPPLGAGDPEEGGQERPSNYMDPRAPVDYARLQADVILAEAEKQAKALLEEARQEGQRWRAEAAEAGRAEGRQAGYAEGLVRAKNEAHAAREEQATRLEAEVVQVLEAVGKAQEVLMEHTLEDLKELALTVAEKVVRVSLRSSGDVVVRMIQGATEKLKRREWVHIYIAGCDAKSMAKIPERLTAALSAVSDHVKIVPMADDESGTCIIEMPDEIIDASASTQLGNVRALISDLPVQDM